MSWNENHIKTLEIQNFKSIKHLKIDCNRINVFVGKPNVGKSNILEGLSLAVISPVEPSESVDLLIRNNNYSNLFFDNNTNNIITIHVDQDKFEIEFNKTSKLSKLSFFQQNNSFQIHPYYFSKRNSQKKYSNKTNEHLNENSNSITFLIPPYGENFIEIIQSNKTLREVIASYFIPYNLEFLVDTTNNKIEIIKRQDGLAFKMPYELMADTLQRMIFYMAAILSNQNAVLIFEEPEAHAYPPFIKQFSEKLLESESNQFFLATHNPYILNTLLENDKNDEVNLFLVDYKDHQTTVQLIGEEEKREMLANGIDIFFNERWFQQL